MGVVSGLGDAIPGASAVAGCRLMISKKQYWGPLLDPA